MSDSIETARQGILANVKAFADAERGIEREQGKQTNAVALMVAAGATPDMLCDPTRKLIESFGIDRALIGNEVPSRLAFYETVRNAIIDSWPQDKEPVKKVLRRELKSSGKWGYVLDKRDRTERQQAIYKDHHGAPGSYMRRLRDAVDRAVNPKTKTTKVVSEIDRLRKRLEDAKRSIEGLADIKVQKRMQQAEQAIVAALVALDTPTPEPSDEEQADAYAKAND
jgi:hypothetical protein